MPVLLLLLPRFSAGDAAWAARLIFFLRLSVGKTAACHLSALPLLFWRSPGGKKKVPWGVSISVTVAVWSPQPTNVEISVFLLIAALHVSCTASCLSDSSTYCLFFVGRSRGMVKLLPTNQKGKYLILLSLQNLLPQICNCGIGVSTATERCS